MLLAASDASVTYRTLKGWLEHDPLDEDLVFRALELCWRYGWVDAGERLFQEYESELRHDVGIGPSERIVGARDALLGVMRQVPRASSELPGAEAHATAGYPTERPQRLVACRPIAAGRRRTTRLPIQLSFDVPEGWEVWVDTPSQLSFGRAADEYRERYYLPSWITVRYNVYALNQSCEEGILADVPIDSVSLSTFWRSLPSVDSSSRTEVKVGGLAGLSLDVAINPSTTQVCNWTQGRPVALLMGQPGPNGLQHGIHIGERLRLTVLDHPAGNLVIEVVHTPHTPMGWIEWMAVTGAIIETFEFALPT